MSHMRSSSVTGAFGLLAAEVVGTSVHAETVWRRELYLACWSGVSTGAGAGFEVSRGSMNGVLIGAEAGLSPFMVLIVGGFKTGDAQMVLVGCGLTEMAVKSWKAVG